MKIYAVMSLALLTACAGGKSAQKSQVVARVNDAEITMLQLQAAIAARGAAPPSPQGTRQTVDSLVNEQLLVDAAVLNKLDRDPMIVQAIEDARRQLLARAYLERSVFPKQEVSVAEQTAYFKNHPALFAQRRTYQLTVYSLARTELAPEVLKALGTARTAEAVSAVLAAHDIESDRQNMTRSAEQLPVEQLTRFASAETGDILVQPPQDGHLTLMLIDGIQSSPVAFESAQPIIQQYLVNSRNVKALEAHLKQARAAAKISYNDGAMLAASAGTTAATVPARERTAGIDTF